MLFAMRAMPSLINATCPAKKSHAKTQTEMLADFRNPGFFARNQYTSSFRGAASVAFWRILLVLGVCHLTEHPIARIAYGGNQRREIGLAGGVMKYTGS